MAFPYTAAKLSADQVLEILRSDLTNRQLADRYHVSDSAIQRLRSGLSYQSVHSDVPRPSIGTRHQGPSCEQCVHLLRGSCSLGFPEAKNRNYRAATHCVAFHS